MSRPLKVVYSIFRFSLLLVCISELKGETAVAFSDLFATDVRVQPSAMLISAPFTVNTRVRLGERSIPSGHFAVDTRFSGSSGRSTSSDLSVDTRHNPVADSAIFGLVSDYIRNPLAGVMVDAIQGGLVRFTAFTDASGTYRLASIPAGTYGLRARRTSWSTSDFNEIAVAPTQSLQRNFVLDPRPRDPTVATTTELPESTQNPNRNVPTSNQLKLFVDGRFESSQPLDPNKMTIVLTHGWNSDPQAWAVDMAQGMVDARVTANIVAWDWHEAADWSLPHRLPPRISQNTPGQGRALGVALYDTLGSTYTRPLHFLGHSLGTLVNAAAVNYLQGDLSTHQPASPWNNPLRIHMTLFDEAELASDIEAAVVFDLGTFARPLPNRFVWADNYMSVVASYHSSAINVYLGRALGIFPNYIGAHSYPMEWYQRTVTEPNAAIVGHRYSFERMEERPLFPTPFPFYRGFLLNQDPSPFRSEMDLIVPVSIEEVLRAIQEDVSRYSRRVYQSGVRVVQGTVEAAGQVVATVAETTVDVLEATGDVIIDGTTRVVSSFGVAIRFVVGGVRPPPPGEFGILGATGPAYARLNVDVPPGASSLVFDFAVEGDGAEDFLVAGINGTNVFALETKFIPADQILTSGSIDVSAYQGQTIELFFGLLGGTSVNATATVQSIRFYTTTPPSLAVTTTDNAAVLTWPAWATHYSLEATPSLEQPDWQPVPDLPAIEGEQQTLRVLAAASARFFRLRL